MHDQPVGQRDGGQDGLRQMEMSFNESGHMELWTGEVLVRADCPPCLLVVPEMFLLKEPRHTVLQAASAACILLLPGAPLRRVQLGKGRAPLQQKSVKPQENHVFK